MEMTGVILVFCVPVVPKAFKRSISISQIDISLRSWTHIVTRNRSGESHQSRFNRAARSKTYRKVDEEPQIGLTNIEALEPAQAAPPSQEDLHYLNVQSHDKRLTHHHRIDDGI